MKESTSADTLFWNSSQVISQFEERPPVQYWREVLEKIPGRETKNALDLGSGGGRNTELLRSLGFRTFACDLNSGMTQTTRNRILRNFGDNRTMVIQGEMSALPFEDQSMDLILSNGVIHNARTQDELSATFGEINRVIKGDGSLLLSMFTADDVDSESLKPDPSHPIYVTNEGLKMALYSTPELLQMLEGLDILPIAQIEQYGCVLDVGKRSILRSVFRKKQERDTN